MVVALVFLASMAAAAEAQTHNHASCPMAAGHKARAAEVDRQHGAATGLDNATTGHHFLLRNDGGEIQMGASDPSDTVSRDGAREHLQAIAKAFANGDFDMPMKIHGAIPPGVPILKERRALVRYDYVATDTGGSVLIATADAQALAAIHAFLRFQIDDHGTGDATEHPRR